MSSSALLQEYGECISSVGSHISLSACETLKFPLRCRRFVFAGKWRHADWQITQLFANRYGVMSRNRIGLTGGPVGQLPGAPSFKGELRRHWNSNKGDAGVHKRLLTSLHLPPFVATKIQHTSRLLTEWTSEKSHKM